MIRFSRFASFISWVEYCLIGLSLLMDGLIIVCSLGMLSSDFRGWLMFKCEWFKEEILHGNEENCEDYNSSSPTDWY